jgi:hypothetical protein
MPTGVYPRKAAHGRVANGNLRVNGRTAFSSTMPTDLFEEVKALAVKEDVTFSHQLCLLLEWGLESIKEE